MNQAARWIILATLFIIPFIPLYVANSSFFPFITGKGFVFRILVEVAAVAYVVLAIADRKYRPRFSWTLVVFGAFTLWMFIADLLAVNPHKAFWSNFERMDGWVTLAHVFLFFLVAGAMLTTDRLWRRWWLTFIGVSAAVCGYGLLQLAGGIEIHQGGVRVDATFGNATYLASYLLFASAITAWQAFESKGWVRYALSALLVLQVAVLFNTATRGAILAFIGASGLCIPLWMIGAGKKGRRVALLALLALLVLIGGFWSAHDTPWVRENPILGRIASITLAEGQTRFVLWGMAVEGIKERPLIGYGQEGFNYLFNEHYQPKLFTQEPWFDRAHNVFVDWLVAGGTPALLLFVALLFVAILSLWRADIPRTERVLLTGAIVAYAFQAMFVFDHLFSYVPLAAILAHIHYRSGRTIPKLERLPEAGRGQAQAIIVPIAGVLLLILTFTVNIPSMRAANDLVYAVSPLPGGPVENKARFEAALADNGFATQEIREQLVNYTANIVGQQSVPEKLRTEFAMLAITEIGKEIERAPADARLHVQAALIYRSVGDYESALAEVAIAEGLSPVRQNFILERGNILTSAGRYEEARDAFLKAYELSPEFPELAAYAASGYVLTGNDTKAAELLQLHFGTTTIDHPALVRAYFETKRFNDLVRVLRLQVENQHGAAGARYRLASGYALAGRYAEARAEAQATMTRYPETQAQGQAFLSSLP